MFYATTTRKCLPRIFVCPSVTSHSYLGTYVLTRYVCSDTLSLTSDDINYVDRGAADPRRCIFGMGDEWLSRSPSSSQPPYRQPKFGRNFREISRESQEVKKSQEFFFLSYMLLRLLQVLSPFLR